MFVGTHLYSIDEKGRLSVPSRFKDALEKSAQPLMLYITKDPKQRILQAYAEDRFNEIMSKISETSRDVARHFAANTQLCPIDKQGRVIVPAELREYAGLKREVAILGVGKNIEVWDRASYESFQQQHQTLSIPDGILY
jgi:MraZ protein